MENLEKFTSKFIELSTGELSVLAGIFQPLAIKKMDHLLVNGDYMKDIFFIDEGLFRGYYLKDGEEFTTGFYFSPLMFAELVSLRRNQPTALNVQALKASQCYRANFKELEKLMELYPNIKKMYYGLYEMLYMYGVRRQVSFIYDSQQERYENLQKEFPKMFEDIPLQYIASYLGLKPETLSRIRKKVK